MILLKLWRRKIYYRGETMECTKEKEVLKMTDFKYYFTDSSFFGYNPKTNKYELFDGYQDYKEFWEELQK